MEAMEIQRALGYEVQEPVFSLRGQNLLEKERKRKKKAKEMYEIGENENEDNSDAEEDSKLGEEK